MGYGKKAGSHILGDFEQVQLGSIGADEWSFLPGRGIFVTVVMSRHSITSNLSAHTEYEVEQEVNSKEGREEGDVKLDLLELSPVSAIL